MADERLQQLMALRAPNTSGVDAKALLQAIAQSSPVPTTYAYGMRPDEVGREAQQTAQAQTGRQNNLNQVMNLAVSQDAQQQNMAMRANEMLLNERRQQFNEQIARAELGYKQAMLAHSKYVDERNFKLKEQAQKVEEDYKRAMMTRIPYEVETAKTNAELMSLKLKGLQELDNEVFELPNLREGQSVVDEQGKPVLGQDGKPLVEGPTKPMPALAALAAGINPGTVMTSQIRAKALLKRGGAGTATQRDNDTKALIYSQSGFSPQDAYLLSRIKTEDMLSCIAKQVSLDAKNIESNPLSAEGFGMIQDGVKEDGTPKMRAKTKTEYMNDRTTSLIDSVFSLLSPEGRDLLKKNYSTTLPIVTESSLVDGVDNEALIQAFIDALE